MLFRQIYILEKEQSYHIVNIEANKLICSCQESIFEGIPCRHELCVYVKASQNIDMLNVQQRWLKEFFDPSSLFVNAPQEEDVNAPQEEEKQDCSPNVEDSQRFAEFQSKIITKKVNF